MAKSKAKKANGPVLGEVALAMPARPRSETVRIRKISNGWLICRETCGPDGYKESEVFSKQKPNLNFKPTT